MKKRWLAGLLTAVMLVTLLPTAALAADDVTVGDFTVSGGTLNTDYTYENNTLTILKDTALTISGSTITDKIVIANPVTANVTLDNVNIQLDTSYYPGSCAFEVESGATCNLTLTGNNILKSGQARAGLMVVVNASLVITENSTGNLSAIGSGLGAGIGGGQHDKGNSCGNITIRGGIVNATGSNDGAGIGGGNMGAGGNIIITGGTINATGGKNGGAGIGGGRGNSDGTFNTGIDGNAFIVASSISDKTSQDSWSGVVFENNNGKLYGDTVTLTTNTTIPSGKTLTIGDGQTLKLGAGVTLTNEGTILLADGGKIDGDVGGTIKFAPPEKPDECYTIDYINETAAAKAGYEISDNNSDWAAVVDSIIPSDGRYESLIYVRKAGTESVSAGDSASSRLPDCPKAPAVQGVDVTAAGNDGTITGVNTTMEYRKDGGDGWIACPDGEITGLSAGNYYVRFKATETAFYSKEAAIALREPAATDQSFCLDNGSINVQQDGDKIVVTQNGVQYTVADGEVRITGNGQSTGNTIRVDGTTADITLSGVSYEGRSEPLSLYNSTVTLTLEGNNTMLPSYRGVQLESSSLTINGSGTLTIGNENQRAYAGINLENYSGNSSVTVNGGIVDIHAERGAISSLSHYGFSFLTVKGGVIRADVSGDRGYYSGLGVPEPSYSYGAMKIQVNGGTVELTGNGNHIAAGNGGTVTVTGGSVTAGGINPAPTSDGSTPVYAVTVDGLGSGAVDALLLKQGDAVQSYGAPACTTDGKVVLYLPAGEYSGAAIVDGKLVNFTCEAKAGDTETTTATDTGVTVTTPEGEKPTINDDGTVTVPDGGTIQTGDGPEITVGDKGGTVGGDGTVTIPDGGTVKPGNGPEITLPDGGTVNGGNGAVTVPDGGTVQVGSDPATTITLPNGEAVKPKEDGTIEVPGGTTVKPGGGGPEITVGPGNGGTVGGNGGMTVEGGGKVTVKGNPDDTTITLPSGGGTVKPNPDGSIPLPGGATVEKGGTTTTVPGAGGTYHPDTGTITENTHTVTFDSQGGSTVSSATATHGGTVTKPGNPTKSGYTFGGWYKESGCTTAWNFDTDTVTGDITLYAKWTQNSGGGGGGTYTPPTYPPTVEKPSEGGGTPSTSPSNPKQGDTVTVTPKPDSGYEVGTITVTDRNGKPVEVTKKPDGTYTFKQPSGKVTIKVTYQPIDLPWNNPFTDVSEGDWYYEAVRFVQERGLMNGYSDGRFGPNDTLSRAQLAQILFNKEGRPGVNYLLTFSDVTGEAWYTEAIRWATSQGIVGGYGNGMFGPNDPITREQLAVMLWRYSGNPAATDKELHFNDADEISGFALEAMRWAVENGILNGYGGGRLGPQGQATRAQVAQMLKNFIENQEENT